METRKDRLTRRDPDGGISVGNLPAALEKLAAYEDAETEGRLATAIKSIAEFCGGFASCDDCPFLGVSKVNDWFGDEPTCMFYRETPRDWTDDAARDAPDGAERSS